MSEIYPAFTCFHNQARTFILTIQLRSKLIDNSTLCHTLNRLRTTKCTRLKKTTYGNTQQRTVNEERGAKVGKHFKSQASRIRPSYGVYSSNIIGANNRNETHVRLKDKMNGNGSSDDPASTSLWQRGACEPNIHHIQPKICHSFFSLKASTSETTSQQGTNIAEKRCFYRPCFSSARKLCVPHPPPPPKKQWCLTHLRIM